MHYDFHFRKPNRNTRLDRRMKRSQAQLEDALREYRAQRQMIDLAEQSIVSPWSTMRDEKGLR